MRSSEKRVRRLRLLITILLAAAALVSAVATLSDRLHLQLWGSLTVLLTVLAVLAPTLQGWLKQAQALLDKQDQKEEKRAKELADRARRDILEQVRRAWVEPELRGSLYEQARIELGLAERPAAVDNPLRAVLRRPDEPDHLLKPAQPIAQVYRQLGKQLLILGEPGAGKSTLLIELTDQLLDEAVAAPDQPMPVVFHLSSWAVERRLLVLWLVDELYKRYGVPRRLGQLWIDTDQVIPLLDGLDEIAAEHRDACVAAINTFHDGHGQFSLVVCSRVTEYEALQAKLRLRGAIVIQPLSQVEVDRYLRQAGRPLAGVRAAFRDDEQLKELLTTPLFLSIVVLTYKDRSAAMVRASGTLEERRQRILADYIEAMLSRPQPSSPPPPYSQQPTLSWLAWLARTMRAHGQSVFYLDWMQPDWLPTQTQRLTVTMAPAIIAGLCCGVIAGLGVALINGVPQWSFILQNQNPLGGLLELEAALQFGLLAGLTVGLIVGLVAGLTAHETTIVPTEQLRWSRTALRRKFRRWLIRGGISAGLVFTVGFVVADSSSPYALIHDLPHTLVKELPNGLVYGVAGGLAVGPFLGLLSGLETGSYVTPPAPGKAIQRSKRNALVSGLSAGLAVGLIAGPILWLLNGPLLGPTLQFLDLPNGLIVGLMVGLICGLIVGLQRGGGAYLRHQVLRWLLIRDGFTPRDFSAFLEYASQLIMLRRRGGGYEFIHRLLLEHFAALKPRSGQAYASQGSLSEGPSVDQQPTVVVPEPNRGSHSGLSG